MTLPRLLHRPGGAGDQTAVGEMVAASPGLTRVHWDECRRLAPLLPPPVGQYPQGALGLFRGQTVEFILARAGGEAQGGPQVQYILLNADTLRKIAGRPKLLLTMAAAPTIPEEGALPPVVFPDPAPATEEAEIDALLDLALALEDNFAAIEGMLAALIQGVPVGIIRGPRTLEKQLAVVQGLLALLPVPARFGVTFSTYARRREAAPVQIAFLPAEVPPQGCVCYDWEAGELLAPPPDDRYSRMITAQFRLDASLAVQQMVAVTQAAGWRLSQGDTLAQALTAAAKRVSLDAAVRDGLPADRTQVREVLESDPTLPDDLRVRYVQHLLALLLAVGEAEAAELAVLGHLALEHSDVTAAMQSMLDVATLEGKAGLVYQMLTTWLADPSGPHGSSWQRRLQTAASAHLGELVAAEDAPGVIAFLGTLRRVDDPRLLARTVPQLLESALPLAATAPDLARQLFLLAAEHLPTAGFRKIAQTQSVQQRLPARMQDALKHFTPGQPTAAPAGILTHAAAAFGPEHALTVLARLVEWVIDLERPDLIDTQVLSQLAVLARSAQRVQYQDILNRVVVEVSRSSMLVLLDDPGPRLLVEIALLLGEYRRVLELFDKISKTLFLGDAQANFAPWVSDVFEHTALATAPLREALETLVSLEMKTVPRVMAYRGALLSKGFDAALQPVIDALSQMLVNDPYLVPTVGMDVCLRLLQHHAKARSVDRAASLAAVITDNVAGTDEGLAIVARIWTMLNWNKDVRQAGLELLRRYVRRMPPARAARIPSLVGRKLGSRVGELLQATVVVSAMTGESGFEGFTEDVGTAAALLLDLAVAYHEKPYPTLRRLRSDLDAMSGGLTDAERDQLSANLLHIGRAASRLGSAYSTRGRDSTALPLPDSRQAPRSGVEAALAMGGLFAEGRALPLNLARESVQHVLGYRTLATLLDETTRTRALLERLLMAFPPEKPPVITAQAFQAEVRSLWASLPLFEQRQRRAEFARDLQALAALLVIVAAQGDARAFEDGGIGRNLESGRREPRSAAEALRLLSGYFARKF